MAATVALPTTNAFQMNGHTFTREDFSAYCRFCLKEGVPLPPFLPKGSLWNVATDVTDESDAYGINEWRREPSAVAPWLNHHRLIFWSFFHYEAPMWPHFCIKVNHIGLFPQSIQRDYWLSVLVAARVGQAETGLPIYDYRTPRRRRDHSLRGVCREQQHLCHSYVQKAVMLQRSRSEPVDRDTPEVDYDSKHSAHGPVVHGGYCADCVCSCDRPGDVDCYHYCRRGCPVGKCKTPSHFCDECGSSKNVELPSQCLRCIKRWVFSGDAALTL